MISYILASPENGPVTPWWLPSVTEPHIQVRVADEEGQHRGGEHRGLYSSHEEEDRREDEKRQDDLHG